MFNLSSIYSARKSSNHKLSKNYKISPDTNLHKNIHKHQTQNFRGISPFGVNPVKTKHVRLGQPGIVDHSINLSRSNKRF